jgi:hypothetical protein
MLGIEWTFGPAKPLNLILLEQSGQEVIILIIKYQLSNSLGFLKSEAMIIMNFGGNGTTSCVIVK